MFNQQRFRWFSAICIMLSFSAGCADLSKVPLSQLTNLTTASTSAPDQPIVSGTPILLYSHIARHIKQCWLNPKKPQLKKHMFFAKAEPDQKGGQATITLNQVTDDGKRGPVAFKVDLRPVDGGKTNVQIHNFRLLPDKSVRLTSDIRYWASGQVDCRAVVDRTRVNNDKITSIPAGITISQMPNKTKN